MRKIETITKEIVVCDICGFTANKKCCMCEKDICYTCSEDLYTYKKPYIIYQDGSVPTYLSMQNNYILMGTFCKDCYEEISKTFNKKERKNLIK